MQTDILVIGGGLSGLTATWQLVSAGENATIMEARTRFGGRILTVEGDDGTPCDLGPSWFWPGQPLVTSLLNHFNIPYFEHPCSTVIGINLLLRPCNPLKLLCGDSAQGQNA